MGRTLLGMAAALVIGALPAYSAEFGDPERGAKIWNKCKSCHKIGKGAKNGVGPHLNELFGRKAGSIAGYRYSKGLLRGGSDGLTWTPEKLAVYLENPKALVSKTRMNFAGLKEPQDRADVLA